MSSFINGRGEEWFLALIEILTEILTERFWQLEEKSTRMVRASCSNDYTNLSTFQLLDQEKIRSRVNHEGFMGLPTQAGAITGLCI